MKKVLITGANSYIGCSFEAYVKEHYAQEISVDTVDMIDGSWREKDFSEYDVVFHVAGIVHQKKGAVSDEIYYRVNRDLVLETAQKAKNEGVRHFVFLSTMSVYGILTGYIDSDTVPMPRNVYGRSKLEAEEKLKNIQSTDFKVTIIRPPMIYGKGCKGNFVTLSKIAHKIPIFPNLKNQRSMLYINSLNIFLYHVIEKEFTGVLLPQDGSFVCTYDMVKILASLQGKKILGIKILNPILGILAKNVSIFQKVFGSLCYEQGVSKLEGVEYQCYTLEEALKEIVG